MLALSKEEETTFFLQEELEKVEETLKKLILSSAPLLTETVSHLILSGGKRLRPILCILPARLLGDKGERAITLGSAIELIHSATLLHDDIIDDAPLRRGKPAAHLIWGSKITVLAGDFLYCQASTLIAEDGDPQVLKIIAKATAQTTEGEVLEIIQSNNLELDETKYLEIIQYKTACLMGAACEVGAFIAQASSSVRQSFKQFGISLGIAFQLVDDALDYRSSVEYFGKKTGTDLREKKITFPILHTLKLCSKEEKKRVHSIFSKEEITVEDFEQIYSLVAHYKGIEQTVEKADFYVQKAKKLLDPFPFSAEKQTLIELANSVLNRNY